MDHLQLLAVDEQKTVCREDGFLILFFKNGTPKELTVASVIPPEDLWIRPSAFLQNIFTQQGDRPQLFLSHEDRIRYGFSKDEPRKVLVTTFEVDQYTIRSGVSINRATVTGHEYSSFSSLPEFERIKNGVEEVLFQYDHLYWRYATCQGEQFWGLEATPSRRLVNGTMSLFDRTLSLLAYQQKLKTLKMTKEGLRLHRYNDARFRNPLRRATSFINMLNLVAHIEGRPLPYSEKVLQEIVGTGYPLITQ